METYRPVAHVYLTLVCLFQGSWHIFDDWCAVYRHINIHATVVRLLSKYCASYTPLLTYLSPAAFLLFFFFCRYVIAILSFALHYPLPCTHSDSTEAIGEKEMTTWLPGTKPLFNVSFYFKRMFLFFYHSTQTRGGKSFRSAYQKNQPFYTV